MNEVVAVVVAIASPIFAAGGAYAATRVHLQWLRRDVDDQRERLDELTKTLMQIWPMSTGKFQALLSHAPTRRRT